MGLAGKKRSLGIRKKFLGKQIDSIFKAIEWSFLFLLCVIAGMFMLDVITQFQAKETIIGHSLKPITKLPTVMLYMTDGPMKYLKRIKIYITDQSGSYNLLQLNESYHDGIIATVLTQVHQQCFKLTSTVDSVFPKSRKMYIKMKLFNFYGLVTASFTSEANSYGIFNHEWFDGKAFTQTVSKGYQRTVSLTSIEHKFLEENPTSECSQLSFLQQWLPHILSANFTNCSEKCALYTSLAGRDFPKCNFNISDKQYKCNLHATTESYQKFIKEIGFKRPCNMLEYEGILTESKWIYNWQWDTAEIGYGFSQPEMTIEYKERLVFDGLGLIAYVGGTLGMCLGFSFIGTISTGLDLIKNRIKALI